MKSFLADSQTPQRKTADHHPETILHKIHICYNEINIALIGQMVIRPLKKSQTVSGETNNSTLFLLISPKY